MKPKPLPVIGVAALFISLMACHSSQSTTYTKPHKTQQIVLPQVKQEMQVEVDSAGAITKQ